jgi:hypothetical protein
MKKLKMLFKSSYNHGWDDGFAIGTTTTLRVVTNMLEKERYKNKLEDPYYDYALKAIIEKIEELNA